MMGHLPKERGFQNKQAVEIGDTSKDHQSPVSCFAVKGGAQPASASYGSATYDSVAVVQSARGNAMADCLQPAKSTRPKDGPTQARQDGDRHCADKARPSVDATQPRGTSGLSPKTNVKRIAKTVRVSPALNERFKSVAAAQSMSHQALLHAMITAATDAYDQKAVAE